MSCLMTIDEKGKVISHKIAETVIRVNERMSYTDVKKILLKEDETVTERYGDLVPMFFQMGELSQILRKRRRREAPLILIFRRARFSWMIWENQWKFMPMNIMLLQSS